MYEMATWVEDGVDQVCPNYRRPKFPRNRKQGKERQMNYRMLKKD